MKQEKILKLNEYIHKKLEEGLGVVEGLTEEWIEQCIVEWYESTFNWQGKPKRTPMWLADWRKFV